MTYRDQIRFKIQKLDRAIKALGDLPTGRMHLASSVAASELATMLKADRTALRQLLGTGRRSCGECGHPMVPGGRPSVYIPEARQTFHMCATDGCGQRGRTIDN